MAQEKNDQFHRDKSFSKGDAAPFGSEPGNDSTVSGDPQSEADVAARGANPDPVGITARSPGNSVVHEPNTLLPSNDESEAGGEGRFLPGPGTSSAPSAAGVGTNSARRVASAQGMDLNTGPSDKNPVDESTRGEGAQTGRYTNRGVRPRGQDPVDASLTDSDRAGG
jgi:hypothetical protein